MILLIETYLKKVAQGRWWKVVFNFELFFSLGIIIVIAGLSYLKRDITNVPTISVSKLAEALNSFCKFGFGATFATLVLAGRWASFNMSVKYILEGNDEYDVIIFRLSWTALVYLGAIFVGKITNVIAPFDFVFPNVHNPLSNNVLFLSLLFLFLYCVLLSISVLLCISSLCVFYSETKEETEIQKETQQ